MRKLLSSILLLTFLFALLGYSPLLLYKQQAARSEMKVKLKKAIPEKELSLFVFSASEYKSILPKGEKEFHYKGCMYDLVKMKTDVNGNVLVYAMNDSKEKEVFANLEKEVNKNTENSSNGKLNIMKLLSSFYPPIQQDVLFVAESKAQLPLIPIQRFTSFVAELNSPPPELAFA